MSDDALEGYRSRPLDEDQLALYSAIVAGDEAFDRQAIADQISVAHAARQFLATDLGRYIRAQVEQREQVFLDAAKQHGHVDDAELKLAHFDYLVAVQTLLWIGDALAQGQEALAMFEAQHYDDQETDQ